MSGRSQRLRVPVRVLCALGVLLTVLAVWSGTALARDYSIDAVDIDATVKADGSLEVVESREFDFDGLFHGVYWKIPYGSYDGRSVEVSVTSVGEMVDGAYVPFAEGYSEQDGTYELTDYGSYIQVKLFSEHEDERAQFVIGYTDSNLCARHEDVAELYWKFVSDGWDVESRNVTCRVHLPVPAGKAVEPEENTRAWGHGPLDASVHFDGSDVIYTVPGVGTSEFAEARITFPEGWLPDAESSSGAALQDILAEERAWADEANARRERARVLTYGGSGVSALGTIAAIVGSLYALLRYRREHRPQFDDDYFRDVPSDDHPAVLGALYRGGTPSDEDFTATLMRLTDLKAVSLDLVTIESKGLLGRTKTRQDYRLACLPQAADMSLHPIDRKALHTMFLDIGRRAPVHDGDDPAAEVVYFGDIEKVAKRHPESFDAAYRGWEAVVEGEVSKRHFFKDDGRTGRAIAGICIAASAVLMTATIVLLALTGAWQLCVPLILLQVGGLVLGIGVTIACKPVSREAIELRAKLAALRRWLKDFTRLNEAVPRDVILWNRLLVMAVVLGVADEVVKQLKMTMPELLSDPLMTTYGWYYYGGPSGAPYRSFQSSYGGAHSVSASKLAASESSSGGGGGGGFSGGGGGGFGGGGGGGAF